MSNGNEITRRTVNEKDVECLLFVDRYGRVMAWSNRNSIHEEQNLRKVSTRFFRGSNDTFEGSTETLEGSAETLEGPTLSNVTPNQYRDGFQAWKMLKQISAQIDNRGPSLF